MKLIEYLPEFLQNIREFKELFEAEDIEIEKLKMAINKVVTEPIVETATSYGLERYEKIYNITDKAETIEGRRFNILLKMNDKVPYSYKWLTNTLDTLVGEKNYALDIDYNNYSMSLEVIALFKEIAIMMQKELREKIPANMKLEVSLSQNETAKQYFAGIIHTGDYIEIRQVN